MGWWVVKANCFYSFGLFWNILYSLRKYTDKFVPSLLSRRISIKPKQILFIVLTAKLFDETYKWTEDDDNKFVNPILNLTSWIDNQITIKSLPNHSQEHEIIIEGIASNRDKEELTESKDFEGGSSDTIKFNAEHVQNEEYQSIEYYCEYHPDTMIEKISITQ